MKKLILFYLSTLAKIALSLHRPQTVIGIAGSVGKSSTRNAIEAILTDCGKTASIGNSETGIPLGILGIKPKGYSVADWVVMLLKAPFGLFYLRDFSFLIVEMGIDDPDPPKNMSYLLKIIKPQYAIFTAESAAHTEQFEKILSPTQKKSLSDEERLLFLTEAITKEDLKMAQTNVCKAIIYNNDNRFLADQLKNRDEKKEYIPFGSDSKNSVWYEKYSITENGTEMTFRKEDEELPIHLDYFLPAEYQEVIAAAIALFYSLPPSVIGLTTPERKRHIISSLQKNFVLPKGRAVNLQGINDSIIIDSSYNASKIAVIAFLDMLKKLKKSSKREVVVILGDMRELGEEAAIEHQEVAKSLKGVCDYLYCVGPLTKEYVMPIAERLGLKDCQHFPSNSKVGEYLKDHLPKYSLVLVKGSQNTIFLEETIKYILKSKNDEIKLCRQDPYWLSLKAKQHRLAAS